MRKFLIVSTALGVAVWLLTRERSNRISAPGWSTKQKVGGTFDQIKGNAKQAAGRATGDNSLAAEGMVDDALGAVKRGLGNAVDSLNDGSKGLKDTAKDAAKNLKETASDLKDSAKDVVNS